MNLNQVDDQCIFIDVILSKKYNYNRSMSKNKFNIPNSIMF